MRLIFSFFPFLIFSHLFFHTKFHGISDSDEATGGGASGVDQLHHCLVLLPLPVLQYIEQFGDRHDCRRFLVTPLD